ncbi:MAG: hypothetical protein HKN85_02595, partial [Gammaproteobacteria bacterium]|nr:hypothetical protein [Gammaproteobacteria bacterium]
MEIIGWVALAAALILTLIGPRNFSRLMIWALSFAKPYGRIAGGMAVAFGAFLLYAFI